MNATSQSNRSFARCSTTWLILLTLIIGTAAPRVAVAQSGRDVIGGLLRGLLESELERRRDDRDVPGRPMLVPERRPNRPSPPRAGGSATMRAREYFGSFGSESKRLAEQLQRDSRKVSGLRSHMSDVLKLQLQTELLNLQYAKTQSDEVLIRDIQALDQAWRATSYKLNRTAGLTDQCKQSIGRLDAINQQCCKLFDLGPQLNRREIVRLADALASEIHHLERDVEFELRGRKRTQQLVMRIRRIETRAKLLSDSAADGDPADILVSSFKQFVGEWNSLSVKLQSFNDRHIDRTVEQIHAINRGMYEQLQLPMGIDRGNIEHLSTLTQQKVRALSDTFSLTMLTELGDGPAILLAAKALNAEATHICECVAAKQSDADLISHWQTLDIAWREFDHYTQPIDSPRIRNLRQQISAQIEAMRHGLGVQLAFDRREVVRLVAELEGIAEQAQHHVGQWQSRPGARVDATMIRSAKKLIKDCHHLHEECAGTTTQERLARDCRKLAEDWSKLRPQLMACQTIDQHTLRRISDQATARLIRLQTILEI